MGCSRSGRHSDGGFDRVRKRAEAVDLAWRSRERTVADGRRVRPDPVERAGQWIGNADDDPHGHRLTRAQGPAHAEASTLPVPVPLQRIGPAPRGAGPIRIYAAACPSERLAAALST
jgi:hypothetical protein